MAGAGYKLFNTGDVLTAAQVNTYLMEQTVMVFADAAARTAALSGVVSEGMISYLKDTNAVEVYNGSAWVASDDPNAIQNTIVDAKGDLITATGNDVPARIAVGNNGESLVADSSTSTGLRWQSNFAAGKNKIINGDFSINQRNFTSVSTGFGFDRFFVIKGGTSQPTTTYSAQTFTPGSAPVAGYEAANFARLATTTASVSDEYSILNYRVEDVRTFANQTVTFSFWAKAASGTPKVGVSIDQGFGSGGSSGVNGTGQSVTISTSWARYSLTFSIPSISGKTIGTSSFLDILIWCSAGSAFNTRSGSVGNQTATIDFWGIQLEAGNVATAFQTATGTLAGELAACQRYYYRVNATSDSFTYYSGNGYAATTSLARAFIYNPVTMRTAPTVLDTNLLGIRQISNDTLYTSGTFSLLAPYPHLSVIGYNHGSAVFTTGNAVILTANNSTASYIGLGAEL